LHGPIETADQSSVIGALWQASERLLQEDLPRGAGSDLELELFGTRILMATLIVRGLRGPSDKSALMDAALALHEMSDRAGRLRNMSEGKSGRLDALADGSAQRKGLSALLRTEAEKLLKVTRLRSKRDRANVLNKRIQKLTGFAWPTRDALAEFARRNKIKI
jgi:hypothetical protein